MFLNSRITKSDGKAAVIMNIEKYQAFVQTVEHGSFTRAAEILNYSQSGISRMIADLEEEWGLTLLERSRAGVTLTSEGYRLYPYAKNLCMEYQKLQMEVDDVKGLQTGLIRIGTFSSVATHWLPNIIREFQKDYPGIDYELLLGDYSEIEKWISDGRVDCGFLSEPFSSGLETVSLGEDSFRAILPEDHPLAAEDRVPLEALCTDPFLLLEKEENREISRLFEKRNLKPNVHFITWDDYAILSMVESGLGISILPELILRRIPYRVAVRELDPPEFRTILFATRKGSTPSAAVRKFRDYLEYRNKAKNS